MSEYIFLFLVVLQIVTSVLAFWMFRILRSRKTSSDTLLIQQQIQELGRVVDRRLSESSTHVQNSVHAQLTESARLVREVTEGLTKLDATNTQVMSFAYELQNLQDILKNPKQRGVLGEYYLETVLKNVLPPGRFSMQYAFPNGDVVDAAIFLDKGKVLPVDSKFSLENYNRIIATREPIERERLVKVFHQDLKNRIDETAKYIRPRDNTMDFAFMFIPSEAIYYDLLMHQVGAVKASSRDLLEYAFRDKKVIIVSPTSFLAYLQTVLQGLRSLEIEESAKEIRKRVEELGRHLKTYDEFHLKLGTSLSTTVNHYNATGKEFMKLNKDVLRITEQSPDLEHVVIERPEQIEVV